MQGIRPGLWLDAPRRRPEGHRPLLTPETSKLGVVAFAVHSRTDQSMMP
jgi:hypothetical protein